MRCLTVLLLLLCMCMPLRATTGQQRAEAAGRGLVGSPAPRLVLKTIDGQTIDLAALYGKKAVYLKFWATWCVPCREQMPHLERTFEQAGADLAVIAIDVGFDDTLADVRAYRHELGLRMPIVFDGDGALGAAFNLRVTPQHVVIGRDGRIRYVGHMADAKLAAALVAARATPAPSVAAGTPPPPDGHAVAVGDRVPAFTARTLAGDVFVARDAAAKRPTALVFLSPWCESYFASSRPQLAASCRGVREQIAALSRTGDVRWLGIASGLWTNQNDLVAYRDKHRIGIPLTLDASGALFRRFHVMHVPTVLLVDAGGHVVRRSEGVDAALPATLRALSAR
jgi:peroxiredoxin